MNWIFYRRRGYRQGRGVKRSLGAALLLVIMACLPMASTVSMASAAETSGFYNANIQQTWNRTDQPVASGAVHRTWMWGPHPDTPALLEDYAESPGGQRVVQYFDKSRMEITHPDDDQASHWYITNGLLAEELITGRMQLGDNTFKQYDPAPVNVAGDPNDASGPTYATFAPLMTKAAIPSGWLATQTVNRAGQVGSDPNLKDQNVTVKDVGAPTQHTVASVFWDFMNSSGLIAEKGKTVQAKLFGNPFYATGYPLTEPYWATVKVGGKSTLVLIQVFERRVLTYTPSNPSGWRVESGNVGQHYYSWRYGELAQQPVDAPPAPLSQQPSPPTTEPNNPPVTDVNCSDFTSQQAAQQWFEQHGGSATNNVGGLDANHDGVACEEPGNTPAIPPLGGDHPVGTTGQCNDGTYTKAQHSTGACSSHGGVKEYWGP